MLILYAWSTPFKWQLLWNTRYTHVCKISTNCKIITITSLHEAYLNEINAVFSLRDVKWFPAHLVWVRIILIPWVAEIVVTEESFEWFVNNRWTNPVEPAVYQKKIDKWISFYVSTTNKAYSCSPPTDNRSVKKGVYEPLNTFNDMCSISRARERCTCNEFVLQFVFEFVNTLFEYTYLNC